MISAELARALSGRALSLRQHRDPPEPSPPPRPLAASGERSVAPGASRVTCANIMLHEQTQVAKCLWQQYDTRQLSHKTQTKTRQKGVRTADPWRPGGEASAASQHW